MLLFDREKYLEGDRYETEKESWLRQRNLKDKLRAIEKEKDDLMRQNQKMGSEIARMINQINRMNSDLNMKDRTIATL